MIEFVYIAGFIILGGMAAVAISTLFATISQGPSEIKRIERSGFGLKAMFNGTFEKENNGSTIDIIEGLEFVSNDGNLSKVRQTRTISDEVI